MSQTYQIVTRAAKESAAVIEQFCKANGQILQCTYAEYARFADDLVIFIDAYRRQGWLLNAVEKRLRDELAKLQVEINEEQSRVVDLAKGERFAFLGFDFGRTLSNNGVWRRSTRRGSRSGRRCWRSSGKSSGGSPANLWSG